MTSTNQTASLLDQYRQATAEAELYRLAVTEAEDRRAAAVAAIHADGAGSFRTLAATLGISPARVQQLVEKGRAAGGASFEAGQ